MNEPSSDQNPLVSICIAARNEEKYIGDTLRSIQAQTHDNFEVLIFDNDSTDETPAICQDICSTDARFNLYRNRSNLGQTYNFNRAQTPARGEYVAIRSGNDLVQPTYLETTLTLLLERPETGMVYSRGTRIDEDGELIDSNHSPESFFETDCSDPVAAGEMVMRCYIHPASYFGLYRKTLLDQLQPMRHVSGGDKIFVCEAALYANIDCVEEPLYVERKHRRQSSLSHIFSEDAVYQLPDDSVFARFETITPCTDMIWGFCDMFSRAHIREREKAQLCEKAHEIFSGYYNKQVKNEKQRLLDIFDENKDHLTGGQTHLVLSRNRHSFLSKVTRMRLILPDDQELKSLAATLLDAL